jgi:hypothetical protein
MLVAALAWACHESGENPEEEGVNRVRTVGALLVAADATSLRDFVSRGSDVGVPRSHGRPESSISSRTRCMSPRKACSSNDGGKLLSKRACSLRSPASSSTAASVERRY